MATLINLYQLSLYLLVATAALSREQRPLWQRLSQWLLQLIGLLGLALTLELAGGTTRTIALTLYGAGLILHGVGLIRPRRRSLAALIFTLALLYQLFLFMDLLPEATGHLNLTAKLLALAIGLGFLLHVLATTAGSPIGTALQRRWPALGQVADRLSRGGGALLLGLGLFQLLTLAF